MMENFEVDDVVDSSMIKEVLTGLSSTQKNLPAKFLYDKKGSEIFLKICQLEEYYPTRVENYLIKKHAIEMAKYIGPNALIIEPGSGSGEKVRPLLSQLNRPKAYIPIEISREILMLMSEEFYSEFPHLKIYPVSADFTQEIDLPPIIKTHAGKKIIFFPGSTIGNFHPHEAVEFMKKYSRLVTPHGGFLIGVDLKKDPETLVRAYDDEEGVTAAFNMNLLHRLNREVNAEFDLKKFHHMAIYNEDLGRVEMHLVSQEPQLVKVNQTVFRFGEGESIHTENSYKYSIDEFTELGLKAKLNLVKYWTDSEKQFCLFYFERE